MTVKAHVQTPALLKADLAIEIYNIIEAQKLTQAKAGKILGVDPSDILRLKQDDFNRFRVERLFTLHRTLIGENGNNFDFIVMI